MTSNTFSFLMDENCSSDSDMSFPESSQSNGNDENRKVKVDSSVEEEYPFQTGWNLWFHAFNNTNWDRDSYILVKPDKWDCSFDNAKDFWRLWNQHPPVSAGSWYLMRKGIYPRWEEPENIDGSNWSFRIPMEDELGNDVAERVWTISAVMSVGETIMRNSNNSKYINGISISPKMSKPYGRKGRSNIPSPATLKIWLGKSDKDLSNPNLYNIIEDKEVNISPYLDFSKGRFSKNKEQKT